MSRIETVTVNASDLLALYKLDQQRRGLQPSTIRRRHFSIALFANWMAPRSITEATRDDIETFLDGRTLAPRSRYGWLSNLGCLYSFAVREELLTENPVTRITRPRLRRLVPRPISDADLRMALAAAPARMRAWLSLAAFEGLRCLEIANLQREDVLDARLPPLLVVTNGKGGNQRVLPLNAHAELALRSAGLPRAGPVFVSALGKPFTPTAVSQRIGEYLHALMIPASAHQLRHWFGTAVYASSQDLRLCQELMGHSSPVTTSHYVAFAPGSGTDVVRHLNVGDAPVGRRHGPRITAG